MLKKRKTLENLFDPIKQFNSVVKGGVFEEFCRVFLMVTVPGIKAVYPTKETPIALQMQIDYKMPVNGDRGVDLFIEHSNGKVSIVQCKFRNKPSSYHLGRDQISDTLFEYIGQSKYDKLYIMTNIGAYQPSKEDLDKIPNLVSIGCVEIQRYPNILQQIEDYCKHKTVPIKIKQYKLRDYQQEAVSKISDILKNKDKLYICLATGLGKTVISQFVAQEFTTILILVPNRVLIGQISQDWHERFYPDQDIQYLLVASNVKCPYSSTFSTTNPTKIHDFMTSPIQSKRVIISTYHSVKLLMGCKFDLAILDEAHHSVSLPNIENYKFTKMLSMTATPRVSSRKLDTKTRMMNNPLIYGECGYSYTLFKGIQTGHLADFDLEIFFANESTLVEIQGQLYDSSILALIQGVYDNIISAKCKKILIYNSTTARSERLYKLFRHFFKYKDLPIHFDILNNKTSLNRSGILTRFEQAQIAILFVVKMLNEGVSINCIDGIVHADRKTSEIAIIQSLGRGLRKSTGKKSCCLMLASTIHESSSAILQQHRDFAVVYKVLRALANHDPAIIQQFQSNQRSIHLQIMTPSTGSSGSTKLTMIPTIFKYDQFEASFRKTLMTKYLQIITPQLLIDYYNQFKTLPTKDSKPYNNYNMFQVKQYLAKTFNQQSITERQELLKIYNWRWKKSTAVREFYLAELANHFKMNKKRPSTKTNLGQWLSRQINKYKDGQMDADETEQLCAYVKLTPKKKTTKAVGPKADGTHTQKIAVLASCYRLGGNGNVFSKKLLTLSTSTEFQRIETESKITGKTKHGTISGIITRFKNIHIRYMTTGLQLIDPLVTRQYLLDCKYPLDSLPEINS